MEGLERVLTEKWILVEMSFALHSATKLTIQISIYAWLFSYVKNQGVRVGISRQTGDNGHMCYLRIGM